VAALYGRCSKKLRSRQRERIEETLTAIAEAEADALANKRKPLPLLTEDDMKRVEMEGLNSPEHLELFVTWYCFGGLEKGISLSELMALPGPLIADFSYLMRELGRYRMMFRRDNE
jgi:hypothetical protein